MQLSRREFLLAGSAAMLGLSGLRHAFALDSSDVPDDKMQTTEYLRLPVGFDVQLISTTGDKMEDGLLVPGKADGMCAFDMGNGLLSIIRNHENEILWHLQSPFSKDASLLSGIDQSKLYDAGIKGPGLGGCSTIVYDAKKRSVVRQFMSLVGTERNCSGGRTPWNSWITSEESAQMPSRFHSKAHGYNFEVWPTTQPELQDPVPLKAMGRFMHESVAFDPQDGVAYQTEDREEGLFYRFVPHAFGKLEEGGKLQALRVRDRLSLSTRNWSEQRVVVGQKLACDWVDLQNVESPNDDLRFQGFSIGAARFARGEGMCYAGGSVYFCCSNGGHAKKGQVWRYTPSGVDGGELELFIESQDADFMKGPDNICLAPNGKIYICEDNLERDGRHNRILTVDNKGNVEVFAENIFNKGEMTGLCFSPDGSTMFVNMQHDISYTFAITGPWNA